MIPRTKKYHRIWKQHFWLIGKLISQYLKSLNWIELTGYQKTTIYFQDYDPRVRANKSDRDKSYSKESPDRIV